jgi:hypothetical protein
MATAQLSALVPVLKLVIVSALDASTPAMPIRQFPAVGELPNVMAKVVPVEP